MAMRAQCSLQFSDKDLYDNFIIPMKNSKDLNTIIIRCLSAYYYNADVRDAIEGIQEDDSDDTAPNTQQEMINNIRESLMLQSFMAQELSDTLANGMEDMEDILDSVNSKAEETGIVHKTSTQTSDNVLRIETAKPQTQQHIDSVQNTQTNSGVSETDKVLASLIERMLQRDGDTEGINLLHQVFTNKNSDNIETQTQANVNQEEVTVQNDVQVSETSEPQVEEFFEEVVASTSEIEAPIQEHEPEPIEDEDSSELLNDLLSDII